MVSQSKLLDPRRGGRPASPFPDDEQPCVMVLAHVGEGVDQQIEPLPRRQVRSVDEYWNSLVGKPGMRAFRRQSPKLRDRVCNYSNGCGIEVAPLDDVRANRWRRRDKTVSEAVRHLC